MQLTKDDFNDYFGIQFHGVQERKKYSIHVEAKIKGMLYIDEHIKFIVFI
jgi:hypothetical protein